jgi:hypothetical protein
MATTWVVPLVIVAQATSMTAHAVTSTDRNMETPPASRKPHFRHHPTTPDRGQGVGRVMQPAVLWPPHRGNRQLHSMLSDAAPDTGRPNVALSGLTT